MFSSGNQSTKHRLESCLYLSLCSYWFIDLFTSLSNFQSFTLLLVFVRVCIHVYTYIHTYIHTHISTYPHTHIRKYVHTYIRTYVHTYIHIHIHTYINCMWACVYLFVSVFACFDLNSAYFYFCLHFYLSFLIIYLRMNLLIYLSILYQCISSAIFPAIWQNRKKTPAVDPKLRDEI